MDSPSTEEANKAVYKLPDLRSLSVVIGKETSLPSASLPIPIKLKSACGNEDDWSRLFRGATFGTLESVAFIPESEQIGDFLGAFKRAALSEFRLSAPYLWGPDYSSLLRFTQMVDLDIESLCDDGYSQGRTMISPSAFRGQCRSWKPLD